jgi:tRNA pseudouridine38-40 synthase
MSNRMDDTDPTAVPSVTGGLPARTWHLSLAYDGTAFHGWQIQPGQRTVQGQVLQRLQRLFQAPDLQVSATSRTDAGVHALDQHLSFTVPTPADLDGEGLRRLLNRWLPEDIRVTAAVEAPAGFKARHANCGKAYTYSLFQGEKVSPLFARFVWSLNQRLDIAAMRQTAVLLAGERDFASFGVNPRREIESTVCHLFRVQVVAQGDLVCVSVVGDRFLYKMVRGLVGYLVHVGHGKAPPEAVLRVLAACDRGAAAQSAPAAGLFLARVFFDPAEMQAYEPVVPPFGWESGERLSVVGERLSEGVGRGAGGGDQNGVSSASSASRASSVSSASSDR